MNRRTLLGTLGTLATAGCLSDVPGVGPPVDADCPDFSEEADSLCAHTDDPALSLRPSSWELADGSGTSLKFTLSNDADETATFAEIPMLKYRTDGEWRHGWPMRVPPLNKQLDPGSSYSWEFAFDKQEADYGVDERVELYELQPRTYGMLLDAELGDRWVQCVAPFEVGDGGGESE